MEDVLFLARQFLEQAAGELAKEPCPLSQEAIAALLAYSWPGNVRELRNVLRRAVLLADQSVEAKHLQLMRPAGSAGVLEEPQRFDPPETTDRDSFKEIVQQNTMQIEKALLLSTLRQTRGNLKEAARILKMDYKTIRTKAKRYELLAELERVSRSG